MRSGLPDAFTPPAFEPAAVVVHEMLLDEANSSQPVSSVGYGKPAARTAGIWLDPHSDGVVTIDRLPGRAAYPIQRRRRLYHRGTGKLAGVDGNLMRRWHIPAMTGTL